MINPSTRERLLITLVALTLIFIWGNSLLPGSVSGAISDRVGQLLSYILGGEVDIVTGHGVLRKLAHATEYLCLGLELFALLWLIRQKSLSTLLLSGMYVALLDETIQLFVPDRAGQIRDVWIDLGGFCLGCCICFCIASLCRRGQRPL